MVDIAKCNNRDCKKRFTCFRYLADADDYYQSYIEPNYTKDNCDMYWRVRNKRELMYMNRVNK